jgi:hypothetical protein
MAISNVPFGEIKQDPNAMEGLAPYVAIYAYDPLKPNTQYRVELKMNVEGEALSIASMFTTGQ